jgi:hypothetical protein
MATKLKHQNQEGQQGGGVVALSKCAADGCKKPTELMNFCKEHYDWFKWGLITKEGKRPVDFDKKYQAFMKRKAA